MKSRRWLGILPLMVVVVLLVVACGGGPQQAAPTQAPTATEEVKQEEVGEEHADTDEHMDETPEHAPEEHMAGQHDVPDEASMVPNPIAPSDESVQVGAEVYATNCAVCHGETGEGDGPAAETLEKPPADLHATHVQELSDGALFYIITHGRPDTPMPAWENVLDEDQRWHVVNFLRTFKE